MATKSSLSFLVLITLLILASSQNHNLPKFADEVEKLANVGNGVLGRGMSPEKSGGSSQITPTPNSNRPGGPATGLYTISLPLPVGGFHFNWGPVGFGFEVGPINPMSPYSPPYLMTYDSYDDFPSQADKSEGSPAPSN